MVKIPRLECMVKDLLLICWSKLIFQIEPRPICLTIFQLIHFSLPLVIEFWVTEVEFMGPEFIDRETTFEGNISSQIKWFD